MSLNPQYFVTSDLDTYFVDKDSGLPLAGGFLGFYRDVARNEPKTVYQLTGAPPNYGYVPLPNPVELSAVGTVQDAGGDNVVIYYYPYDDEGNLDLYYVTCTDSNEVEQFTREAWPNITSADNPTTNNFAVINQLSNPQFTHVFINENQSITYTVSASNNQIFAFAPDWDFVISGTGTVIVERIAIAGNENVATSPPYVLDISVSVGITSCYLRQRLYLNSGLWASTANESVYLSGTLIAINEQGGSTGIEMFYAASIGGSPITIVDATFDNSGYQFISGVTEDALPLSTDTNTGYAGYVDIYLSFLIGSHIRISSIQVVPTLNQAGATIVQYDLNSSNREQALLGDYYIPRLNTRPVASLLTAWDFVLNPFQFAASGDLTTTAGYICDQTIGYAGSTGNVAFAIDPVTDGLALTTGGSNDAFYLMQYLSGAEAKKILGTKLSVNVFGYVTSTSNDVTMSIYLFRAPSTSSIPILSTSIGTVSTNGTFTLSASGWTQIPRSGLDTAQAILPYLAADDDINNYDNDMSFTGWQITDNTQISDTDYFAIVVTFAYIDTSTTITINSISVTPSDIPTRPAPQSSDQVLQRCQYYYETSYDLGVYPGDSSTNGAIVCEQYATSFTPGMSTGYPRALIARYVTPKRVAVTPSIYSTDGMSDNIFAILYKSGSIIGSGDNPVADNWTLTYSGETGFYFQVTSTSAIVGPINLAGTLPQVETIATFHFVADARLGIV
jgi:hypothetical protein